MGEFIPRFEERDGEKRTMGHQRLGTGGAIPVKNEKGQIVMQKVKVQRYMAGKAPAFANSLESSDSDEEVQGTSHEEEDRGDRKGRNRMSRFDRPVHEAEIVGKEEKHSDDEEEDEDEAERRRMKARARRMELEEDTGMESGADDYDDEEEMERRRRIIKERLMKREMEENETLVKEDSAEEEEEESEYSSSEEEEEEDDIAMRLKPVFVRKKDRITLMEADREQKRLEELKLEEERRAEEKRRESVQLAHDILKEEEEAAKRHDKDEHDLAAVVTDDENEEMAYEEWKLREMKRLKRNREEREAAAKERGELERVHAMTEEERRAYLRANPKIITNKAEKGKYKFLQKYFHRGVFFLDEEEDIFKRNFNEATKEDKFDKTVMPKVMQVKDFGKASRSKWTHLTAEDTTEHQGVWATATALNVNFTNKSAAGMKQTFERPAAKKRKTAGER